MIEKTQEDYLRTIYNLYEDLKDKSLGIKSVEIARSLMITKPTVSRVVKKLTNQKYIISEPYSRIHLTKEGLKEAKKIMYKHRIIEVFLTKALNYDHTDKIHKEAHQLEHSFSDESIRRIDKLLEYPKKTMIGKTIPR